MSPLLKMIHLVLQQVRLLMKLQNTIQDDIHLLFKSSLILRHIQPSHFKQISQKSDGLLFQIQTNLITRKILVWEVHHMVRI